MEKWEFSYIAGGNTTYYNQLAKLLDTIYKNYHILIIWPMSTFLRYLLKGNKNICPYKNLVCDIYS